MADDTEALKIVRVTGGGRKVTRIKYSGFTGGGTKVTKYVVGEPPADADPDTNYIRVVGGGTKVTKIDYTLVDHNEYPPTPEPPTYVRIVRPEPEPDDGPDVGTPIVPTPESLEYRRSALAKIAGHFGKPIPAAFQPAEPDEGDR